VWLGAGLGAADW